MCLSGYVYQIRINIFPGAVRKKQDNNCSTYNNPALYVDTGYQDVSPDNVRVFAFSVSSASPYNISMRLAIGTNDLLVDDSGNSPNNQGVDFSTIKCKPGIAGSEYCAMIPLSTTVTRRMAGL